MINIVKADGTLEKFSDEKLILSIRRAGIPENLENELLEYVKQHLYDKIPSYKIYKYIQEHSISLQNRA